MAANFGGGGQPSVSSEQIGSSQPSVVLPPDFAAVAVGGGSNFVRRRKVSISSAGTATFGSSILFGDNVPLPPISEAALPEIDESGQPINIGAAAVADALNWTGSCIMSLTKIPLPDVFVREQEELEQEEEGGADALERLGKDTGLIVSDQAADGIYRVPKSSAMCGWWLCWRTLSRKSSIEDLEKLEAKNDVEMFNKALEEGGKKGEPFKFPQAPKLVLARKCNLGMPKSICDVLITMTNLSLLKSKSFSVFCLASLIAVTGKLLLYFECRYVRLLINNAFFGGNGE